MSTTPKKKKRATVDLTDFTLDQLDEAAKLMDEGHGRVKSYVYVGRHLAGMPDLTLESAGQLTMRDVELKESDPDDDDDTPTPAP